MLEQVLSTAKAPETSGFENKVRQSLPNQASFAELLRGAGASDKTIEGLEKLAALNVGGASEEGVSGADLKQAEPAVHATTVPTGEREKESTLKSAPVEPGSGVSEDAPQITKPDVDETLTGQPLSGVEAGEQRAESDLVQASPFDKALESEKTGLTNKTAHADMSVAESESRQPASEAVSEELLSQQTIVNGEESREREVFLKELAGQSDGNVRASERVAEMRSDARGGRSGGNAEPPTWSSSALNGNKTPGPGEQGASNPGQSHSGQSNQGQASQQQFMQMAQVQAQNQQVLRQQGVDRQVSIQTAQSQGNLEGTADDESLEWLTAGASSLNADKRPQLPAGLQTIGLPVSHQKWGQALGQRVTYMVNNQIQQAQITLNPEKLGPVQIKLHVDRDQQVHVVMSAQQGVTREAMEAAMPRLREMLEQSGIDLASVDVSDQQAFSDDSGEGEDPEQTRALSENGAVKDATEPSEESDTQTYTTDNLVDYYA